MKIKTIKAYSPEELDALVNTFIDENASEVKNVQFQMSGTNLGVMILYQPKPIFEKPEKESIQVGFKP